MSKSKHTLKKIIKHWPLYAFLFLPVLYIFVFKYLPMGGLAIAFQDFRFRRGIFGSEWVGFKHFIDFFQNYNFKRTLLNTIVLSVYNLMASFPLAVLFALVLNSLRNQRFQKVTQAIACLPHFISTVVMVGIVFQLFDSRTGLYGIIGEALTGAYPDNLFASGAGFRHAYVWSGVWKSFGWGSILYTAALAGIDPSYHEAAQIDGATRWQRIWHIDLPGILPTIITMLILNMGSIMNVGFEKVLLMQNTLNLSASEIISTYSYRVGLAAKAGTNMSYGAAIGLFNSVVNFILLVSVNKISKKVSDTSLW